MIEFQGLAKNYGNFHAVKPLTLSVARGEVFGFLGPSGAGKTTTIRMMMGILAPSSGQVGIDGLDCHGHRAEVKRRIGYLPDNPIFYDYLRGREILQFAGEMHGFPRSLAAARADQLLKEFELDDATEEFAVNYSFGMKKKLGLACALIHDPQVLILDEPLKGLDPRSARDMQERLQNSAAQGKTIFVSTHLPVMAERFCSRVGIIHHGELIAAGNLREIKSIVVSGSSLEDAFVKIADEANQNAPMSALSLVRAAA
ncbi:MAG TPA: ABC transporter ATP-binding protein [Burkholderiaceae bacterium]|nr:ABC transporter ATP-binding protein [Burkholderiaceae bacterium]